MKNITFISASAGSGKTHRITRDIVKCLVDGSCRPGGLMATTFTRKAANELRERLRQGLYQADRPTLAEGIDQGLIGTVHSVCGQLLQRFAFEAGISPRIEILPPEEVAAFLGQAVEMATDLQKIEQLQQVAHRLGQSDPKTTQFSWKNQVRQIIDAMRANDLAISSLAAMGEESINSLSSFLLQPTAADLDGELAAAMEAAQEKIAGNGDATKVTAEYLGLLRASLAQLQAGRLPWSEWAKLSKTKPGATSLGEAKTVLDTAAKVESHPRLHEDIRTYTRLVFAVAGESLATFQKLKEERGLLDYTDLEQRACHLLRNTPVIRDILKQELDLLVVDEFQDTSPIQLALFMQLASCARQVIWVGDVKQAIYGFRDSDPELVRSVVEAIKNRGGTIADPLNTSWRSSPALVDAASDLFAPAFRQSLGLEDAEVRLKARPGRIAPSQPAVEFFELTSGEFTKDARNPRLKKLNGIPYADALADGVARLLTRGDGCQAVGKATHELRRLELRDVAILCRSQDAAAEAAEALVQRGFPVTRAEIGLLTTPEARLAIACLRRLADPFDTLATAEIAALSGTQKPEEWLASRLDYLASQPLTRLGDRWGMEAPFIVPAVVAIDQARARLKIYSPSEALAIALIAADVLGTVSAWGPSLERSAQRRANLESLRSLAAQYEEACATSHIPATIAGFLFWCDDRKRSENDAKASDEQANAIYVGTYHSAKGLEWPVVVCSSLDNVPKPRLWEVQVAARNSGFPFDPDQPLANRCLRFWVWPFGKQKTGIALADRIEASLIGKASLHAAEQEELRLLYVGLTRPRDLLILARDKAIPAAWLDSLKAPWFVDNNGRIDLPSGGSIPCRTVEFSPPQNTSLIAPAAEFAWFPPPLTRSGKKTVRLTPSGQAPVLNGRCGETINFGMRLPVAGKYDESELGDAIHAIFAAELLNPGHESRLLMATRTLHGFGLASAIDPEAVIAAVHGFRTQILNRFQPGKMLVEVPFTVTAEEGRQVTGIMDLLLETAQGWIIIDHKSFPGGSSAWPEKALSFSGQLDLYRKAVVLAKGPVVGTWIHFAVGGGLVEVQFDRR